MAGTSEQDKKRLCERLKKSINEGHKISSGMGDMGWHGW